MNVIALMDDLERDVLRLAIYVMELAEESLLEEAMPVSKVEQRAHRLMAICLETEEAVTQEYLSRQTGYCRRTLQKALEVMEQRGWIVRQEQRTWKRISVRRAA